MTKSKKDPITWPEPSPEAQRILLQAATERPWSSPLLEERRKGHYHCAGCGAALFDSSSKYDSGSGWPSFDRVIDQSVDFAQDNSLPGQPRIEYHCRNCGGHHGHLFNDGPTATGQRFCNNGLSLLFVPEDDNNDNS
jgi:peptide-methionine (R)-S-oxide reductase